MYSALLNPPNKSIWNFPSAAQIVAGSSIFDSIPEAVYKIALISFDHVATSPHDDYVIARAKQSSGRGELDTYDRLVYTGTFAPAGEGTLYKKWFLFPGSMYSVFDYVAAEGYDFVMCPYGVQEHIYYRRPWQYLVDTHKILGIVGTGQSARDFSYYDEPDTASIIYISSDNANSDFGNGVECRVVPTGTLDVGGNAGSLSDAIGAYTGAYVRALSQTGNKILARMAVREALVKAPYTKRNGYGVLTIDPELEYPAPVLSRSMIYRNGVLQHSAS